MEQCGMTVVYYFYCFALTLQPNIYVACDKSLWILNAVIFTWFFQFFHQSYHDFVDFFLWIFCTPRYNWNWFLFRSDALLVTQYTWKNHPVSSYCPFFWWNGCHPFVPALRLHYRGKGIRWIYRRLPCIFYVLVWCSTVYRHLRWVKSQKRGSTSLPFVFVIEQMDMW